MSFVIDCRCIAVRLAASTIRSGAKVRPISSTVAPRWSEPNLDVLVGAVEGDGDGDGVAVVQELERRRGARARERELSARIGLGDPAVAGAAAANACAGRGRAAGQPH